MELQQLTDRFENERPRLWSVAYRMLGSQAEAEDAVQEAWLRLNRLNRLDQTRANEVENLPGWLTTVVARVSLDMLRSRSSRREAALDDQQVELESHGDGASPEGDALMADEVGPALMLVLDALSPAERLSFVLHDLFGVPFDEIAVILDRTPDAARQLASRARRRVRGQSPEQDVDAERQREVVSAFLRASRGGDFEALLTVLDPDVVVRADATAAQMGAAPEVRGATAVLNTFLGRAVGAQPAIVNGLAAAAWAPGGTLRVVFSFTVTGDRVAAIDLIADRERLEQLDIELLPRERVTPSRRERRSTTPDGQA